MVNSFDTRFFLGEMPEANYGQFVERTRPRQQRRYFANLFSEIQRDYNKALAGFAAQNPGVSPTSERRLQTFTNFLEDMDWEGKFYERPPWERDPNYQAFNPLVRYRY